ncbi:hypothetical protein [Fimbriimonas ginsengisoli]|uniref:Uncharacterized protein n=1 Tax=Fimbriimonas ginsengisoli Gsoil 348 TaxID=661478 RepID=A0A068NN34_FIMGI|nr:hypothetical protein [Fimbriimonas ginsengisoli]AIE84812.1 hypothetical protein OP10G_1444 [Fimbriimonas ginsengisoli Gsoil 348]
MSEDQINAEADREAAAHPNNFDLRKSQWKNGLYRRNKHYSGTIAGAIGFLILFVGLFWFISHAPQRGVTKPVPGVNGR